MAWAKNGTPDTLSGTADELSISDLTALKFNQFLCHTPFDTSTIDHNWNIENNSATDYARRISSNGGADTTSTSATYIQTYSDNHDGFTIGYCANIDSEEKLFIFLNVGRNAAGAANAPIRNEVVGKEDATTNTGQFTRIDVDNASAGSYATDSNLTALGTD